MPDAAVILDAQRLAGVGFGHGGDGHPLKANAYTKPFHGSLY
jgi:hypothetical protein